MQLESFLEHSAQHRPDKIALVCGQSRLTYAELESRSNRLAHALMAEGIERGDRVAVYLPNTVEAVVSIFAIFKAGAVLMMVNPTTKAAKLAGLLANSRARTIVVPAGKTTALDAVWRGAAALHRVIATGARGEGAADCSKQCVGFDTLLARHARDTSPPEKRAIDVDLAALLYTSGSTGAPKGVMLTHRNMVSAATSITTYLENTPEDVVLNVLPLSFGYGLYQVLMAPRFGGAVVLAHSFAYPHAVLKTLVDEHATGFPLVPTMAAILLQMDLGKYDFSRLRYLTSAGAALPAAHLAQLRRALPHVRIYPMYGQSECTRVTYLAPEQVDRRPTSVGRGMPNEEVVVVDADGRRVGPGVVGELVVRGSHVMSGYWELPELTAASLRPGPLPGEKVLWTGDLFRADEEGYLYFVGRKDDIIKSRGEKVSPKEVENVLYDHPDVAEAAVVGVPDDILGQAIKAVLTLKPGRRPSEQDVLRHCADRLEDFMVPQLVEFRATLPKGATGKIDKRELSGATS
jgi:amino acid adenylation domain-containing protein